MQWHRREKKRAIEKEMNEKKARHAVDNFQFQRSEHISYIIHWAIAKFSQENGLIKM